jgi:flagellar motility protein MotE (MotC chaperone)
MSKKMRIILVAGLLVLSFALSCGVSLLLAPSPAPRLAAPTTAPAARPGEDLLAAVPMVAKPEGLQPRQRQLEELIRDVRARRAECIEMRQRLEQEAKRMEVARALLKKEGEDLEKLRFRLVGPLTELREAKADLEKSRILIAKEERANLKRTAAIYEKMDPASGSEILEEMCANQQETDAAKILRYMSERSAAKVLAGIKDKALAAKLSDMLKRMREQG